MKRFIRTDDKAVSPVIAVILMVAITVVLAGVLWAMLSGVTTDPPRETTLSSTETERNYGWAVNIIGVSGSEPSFDDVTFQVINDQGIMEYKLTIDDANPSVLTVGLSKVYAITNGAPVKDNTTGNVVDSNSKLTDYDGCNIAYIDQDTNGKISEGDIIHIYKDYDDDGHDELESNFVFEIIIGDDRALHKPL